MQNILQIKNLNISFRLEEEKAQAVHDLNLTLEKGKVIGIVGESGCGKSVSAMSVLRLLPSNSIIDSGEIIFNGKNLLDLSDKEMQSIRGSKISLIPQDPLTSLNPLYTVGEQIIETIRHHMQVTKDKARKLAIEALQSVKIPEAEDRLNDYPHQFSGGMRQRAIIAMALCCNPELIIADEPTTALDVTVQAQILDLIKQIQKDKGTSLIFITHDLGVIAEFCDYVAVMYAGRVVEYSTTADIFSNHLHPYTQGLFDALPSPDKETLNVIPGQPPQITENISGCVFHPRCPQKIAVCEDIEPCEKIIKNLHAVSCHLY